MLHPKQWPQERLAAFEAILQTYSLSRTRCLRTWAQIAGIP